jgi:hypothetical protein
MKVSEDCVTVVIEHKCATTFYSSACDTHVDVVDLSAGARAKSGCIHIATRYESMTCAHIKFTMPRPPRNCHIHRHHCSHFIATTFMWVSPSIPLLIGIFGFIICSFHSLQVCLCPSHLPLFIGELSITQLSTIDQISQGVKMGLCCTSISCTG